MSDINGYSEIYNIGNKAIEGLLDMELTVEEKVDGSQFSVRKEGDTVFFRSHGKQVYQEAPEKMFAPAVLNLQNLDFHDGWTYRGEYLKTPHHNTLSYTRVPVRNWVIFDIDKGDQDYMEYDEKAAEAERLGLECVPFIYRGIVTKTLLEGFLQTDSFLGGSKIEGVVMKNYGFFNTRDHKVTMAKFVSEVFKEDHKKQWGAANPHAGDFIDNLVVQLKTEARWQKAVQHLSENGTLLHDPKDIGLLMRELGTDLLKDEEVFIREALFKYAWPKIQRGVAAGLAEWYKNQLVAAAFGEEAPSDDVCLPVVSEEETA